MRFSSRLVGSVALATMERNAEPGAMGCDIPGQLSLLLEQSHRRRSSEVDQGVDGQKLTLCRSLSRSYQTVCGVLDFNEPCRCS